MPAIDDVFDGGERIRITNLVNGARFRVTRGGSTSGPYRTWGAAHLVTMTPAVSTGETIEVVQTMCPSNPSSDPGSTVVLPCSELPAPTVHPIEVGAPIVVVTGWVAGAQIKVFQGMQKIGDGGPPVVVLTQPIQPDTPVYVIQVVGSCTSRFARVVTPRCVAPPTGGDPAGRNLFPVGFKDYADGPYKGSVYYPAEDDGEDQPFNKRWGDLGRSPIVVMAHGNHYTYYMSVWMSAFDTNRKSPIQCPLLTKPCGERGRVLINQYTKRWLGCAAHSVIGGKADMARTYQYVR